jgi:hypothetical protein
MRRLASFCPLVALALGCFVAGGVARAGADDPAPAPVPVAPVPGASAPKSDFVVGAETSVVDILVGCHGLCGGVVSIKRCVAVDLDGVGEELVGASDASDAAYGLAERVAREGLNRTGGCEGNGGGGPLDFCHCRIDESSVYVERGAFVQTRVVVDPSSVLDDDYVGDVYWACARVTVSGQGKCVP